MKKYASSICSCRDDVMKKLDDFFPILFVIVTIRCVKLLKYILEIAQIEQKSVRWPVLKLLKCGLPLSLFAHPGRRSEVDLGIQRCFQNYKGRGGGVHTAYLPRRREPL